MIRLCFPSIFQDIRSFFGISLCRPFVDKIDFDDLSLFNTTLYNVITGSSPTPAIETRMLRSYVVRT